MSQFQFLPKQDVDPLADAKAWLTHMEKTLAKLAAERVRKNEDDPPADGGRPFSNAKISEATKA